MNKKHMVSLALAGVMAAATGCSSQADKEAMKHEKNGCGSNCGSKDKNDCGSKKKDEEKSSKEDKNGCGSNGCGANSCGS